MTITTRPTIPPTTPETIPTMLLLCLAFSGSLSKGTVVLTAGFVVEFAFVNTWGVFCVDSVFAVSFVLTGRSVTLVVLVFFFVATVVDLVVDAVVG